MTTHAPLRFDLFRRYWPLYLAIATITIGIQVVLVAKIGVQTSPDFTFRYDPAARQVLSWSGLSPQTSFDEINPYAWARIGYIAFVAICYLFWGIGNATAVVYTQLAIVWLVQPLMFHILLHITDRPWLSVGALAVWLTFLDAYQWNTWALPDALYRGIVIVVFFVALRMWEQRRPSAFAAVIVGGTLLASTFRVETLMYTLPAMWLVVRQQWRSSRATVALTAVAAVIALALLAPLLTTLARFFEAWFSTGTIFLSVDPIEGVSHITPPADHSFLSKVAFTLHVIALRGWYSITPIPAYWSRAHQLYYAAYMIPFYALTLAALPAAIRNRNYLFLVCLWIFVASVILRMFTHVDSPMRYAYTPQVFLFFCAVLSLWLTNVHWQWVRARFSR